MSQPAATAPDVQLGHSDPVPFEDGPGQPRCAWNRTVCSETPTQVFRDAAGHADLYCDLHALLELRFLLDVHIPFCDDDTASHIVEVTPLS